MYIQSSLFADEAVTVLHDAEGGVRYHPGCVGVAEQNAWLDALQRAVAWREEERSMYDRIVAVPRLMASLGLHDPDCPPCVHAALAVVQALAPAPYTRAGLNLYRGAQDSVALHHDRLHDLAPGQPIAILSLGAPREMLIRPQRGRGSLRVVLGPGSLLVMSHASQKTHLHGIPKAAEPVGPRISLAFRVRT